MKIMKRIYASIFLIAFSTLLLEITLTRIYSVIFFYNFAFMIISSALFGYGLSAVWIIIFYDKLKRIDLLKFSSLLLAISILILTIGLSYIPASFSYFPILKRIVLLFTHYVILIMPFFFSGMFISTVFMRFTHYISKLYFFDLLGASIGAISMLILIKSIGAVGLLFLSIIFSLIASITTLQNKHNKYVLAIVIMILLIFLPGAERFFTIKPHMSKIAYYNHLKNKMIIYNKWSSITKIDVVKTKPMWIIWIDGGTNISFIPTASQNESLKLSYKDITSLPYKLIKNPTTLIIGSGGGWEVKIAKELNAKKIIAVEMDSLIVDIVKNIFKKDINNLFDQPNISLIANEGRNFLHSSNEKFDIIQQINNQTSIAIASGALNLSETYLLTKEALFLYWQHLNDNGMLSIWKWGIERLFTSAVFMLHEIGLTNPHKHIFIIQQHNEYQKLFLLKKSPFSIKEITLIEDLCKNNSWEIIFHPMYPYKNQFFSKLLTKRDIINLAKSTGLNLLPATDNKPFFNHMIPIWQRHIHNSITLPKDTIQKIENVSKTEQYSLGIVFIQSLLFSILFLLMPLLKFKKEKANRKINKLVIFYFSGLGIGFILLEIVMMQKFVLFLGHPAYSISIILFSILISAGIGSYLSGIIINTIGIKKHILFLFISLLSILLFYIFIIDFIIVQTIHSGIVLKGFITFFLVFLLGLMLGMPFPTGLYLLSKELSYTIAWAWAINAYMTVLGSMLSIIIAISFGFLTVLICAFICYLIAFITILRYEMTPLA